MRVRTSALVLVLALLPQLVAAYPFERELSLPESYRSKRITKHFGLGPGERILAALASLQPLRSAEPTEEKITELCRKIEDSVKIGDPRLLARSLDLDVLLSRALDGLELPEATLRSVRKSFVQQRMPFQLAAKLVTEVRQGGTYRFLRVHEQDGEPRALFRLTSQAGLNYHDLRFTVASDGEARVADLYVLLSGEDLSQTLRRTFLPLVAQENRSWLEKMVQRESEYVRSLPSLTRFLTLGNQGEIDEALRVYSELPKSVREQRFVLLARISALARVLGQDERYDEMYASSIRTYLGLYPEDANVDLLLLDHHVLRQEYDKAYAAVERLDEKVGGDPYLNLLRGNVRCLQKRYPEGRALVKRTIAECPDHPDAYFALIEHSLGEKDFATTSWTLDRLRERLGVEYEDLKEQPLFAEYVKSPEYAEWIQRRKASAPDDGEVSPKD